MQLGTALRGWLRDTILPLLSYVFSSKRFSSLTIYEGHPFDRKRKREKQHRFDPKGVQWGSEWENLPDTEPALQLFIRRSDSQCQRSNKSLDSTARRLHGCTAVRFRLPTPAAHLLRFESGGSFGALRTGGPERSSPLRFPRLHR